MERERAVLPPAVVVDPRPIAHLERTVADLAARAQQGAHLLDRVVVVALDLEPVALLALATHQHAEIGQLVHRPDREPATPFEELVPLVGEDRPIVDRIVRDPAVEREIVRPRDDDQWV